MTLDLHSRPETPTLVRAMLSALAEALSVDAELIDDLKTAISEACNNVVLHAYPDDQEGPLSVELYALEDRLTVVVRDGGVGLAGAEDALEPSAGVGIPVIRALTQEAEFNQPEDGGTEVLMSFAGVRGSRRLYDPPLATIPNDGWASTLDGDAVVSISPVELLGGVLGRLARTLAAIARFSLDRFADVYLVTDAVAAHASDAASVGRIAFALTAGGRRLELSVGPLERGSGEWIAQQAERQVAPSPLTLLSDQLRVDSLPGDRELMRIVMVDHRG